MKVLALDPLSYAALFRLSNVYEQERDYVNALKHFELALSILPVFERSTHNGKLSRLKGQAEDARAHVIRVDPFTLPHEVILLVMQNGREEEKDFVLRCTWVCRHWRQSLINTPTLWGTLIFDPEEFRNKKAVEKRKAYIARSGKKVHTVEFNKLLLSTVGKIHKNDRHPCNTAKILNISVASPLVLSRLSAKFQHAFSKLEQVTIDGGFTPFINMVDIRYRHGPRAETLHCGFVMDRAAVHLRHLDLRTIALHDEDRPSLTALWDTSDTAGGENQYSSLRSLRIERCGFMNAYIDPPPSTGGWQSDQLHRALRTAPALETLVVIPSEGTSAFAVQPGDGKKCVLECLRSLSLPSPSQWAIDIIATNVDSLKFVMPRERPWGKKDFLKNHVRPLIPAIRHSPVPEDSLWRLTHVELQCCDYDNIDRLN